MANVVEVIRTYINDRADNTGEQRGYRVEFDDVDFTLWDARSADDGITAIEDDGDPLTVGSNLVVTSKVATRVREGPKFADVLVTFSVPQSNVFPQPTGETRWGVTIEAEGVEYTENVNKDTDGAPLLNSADQLFPEGQVKQTYDEQITIAYTTDTLDWDSIGILRGKLNDAPFTLTIKGQTRNFDIRTVKVGNLGYSIQIGPGGENWWRVRIPLLWRYDDWVRLIEDRGTMMLADTGEAVDIYKYKGLAGPQYLDGSGGLLAAGADVETIPYQIEDEADITPLFTGLS